MISIDESNEMVKYWRKDLQTSTNKVDGRIKS